jgi:hypothetical protein
MMNMENFENPDSFHETMGSIGIDGRIILEQM